MNRSIANLDRVLIVGAGIAGCAAAISLAERGVDVTVIEKQDEWRFASSGIFIYSNGLESLNAVGVLDEIVAAGYVVNDGKNIYTDHQGKHLVDVHYPRGKNDEPPVVGIKRGEMQRILALRLSTLGVTIRLGTSVLELEPGGAEKRPMVTLSDGTSQEFDLVIGADGIRSQVRSLIGINLEPVYTSFAVWRSVHIRPPELDSKIMMMGIGKRLGIMPISDDGLYIFGTVVEDATAWHPRESWPSKMRDTFQEFGGPVRQFLDQLSDASEILYTKVEEVSVPSPWNKGRVVLIGDAAHASTPFMGQGGAMAVEDAVQLTRQLMTSGSIDDALIKFGNARFPVCKFVQDVSRKVGEAGAIEDEQSCAVRNASLKKTAQFSVDRFYRELRELTI